MAQRPHFIDLQRRYREADYVSEYQRLWAIFNHWLQAHTGHHQHRDCIEALKTDPNLADWIERRLKATVYPRPQRVEDGYVGGYPRFAADNEISLFFRAAPESVVVEPRINRPWRPGSEPRVRITNAITLSQEQFLKAYRAHAQVLEEGIGQFDLTIDQTLPALGIHATGCCFYNGEIDATLPAGSLHWANRMVEVFETKPELGELVNLVRSENKTTLENDVMETLYNVRNVAMHGSLDFLNEKDNAIARAAFDLLDSLIRDVREHW